MGVLTDDENLVDAALSEIVALPLEQRHQRDPRRDVDYLLMQYHLGQVSSTSTQYKVQKHHAAHVSCYCSRVMSPGRSR